MIDKANLPTDIIGAASALKQRKIMLLELHAEILEHELTEVHQATGLINNIVEELDRRLDDGDLWGEDGE